MTLTITYSTDEELDMRLTGILTARGYRVLDRLRQWETPQSLCKRLGIKNVTLCMRLKRYTGDFLAIRGSRRIRKLMVDSQLERYLSKPVSRVFDRAESVGKGKR